MDFVLFSHEYAGKSHQPVFANYICFQISIVINQIIFARTEDKNHFRRITRSGRSAPDVYPRYVIFFEFQSNNLGFLSDESSFNVFTLVLLFVIKLRHLTNLLFVVLMRTLRQEDLINNPPGASLLIARL